MQNLAMMKMLETGEALNVLTEGRRVSDGMFELRRFVEGKDYCDPSIERWIWSIGKHVVSGKIFAATDIRFNDNPNYDLLFLR